MWKSTRARRLKSSQGGSTLVVVAVSLVFLLGMAGLAIDLANLYVARNEAQRAADAGALAAATAFVTSGYTSGGVDQATAQLIATNQATTIGNQNLVGGQAGVQSMSFNFNSPGNPQVTVVVGRTAAAGNAMPTMFMKIFGIGSADVSATATAEAYNPSGEVNGPIFCTSCIKPILLPNCDAAHPPPQTPASTFCSGSGIFIDPNTGAIQLPQSVANGGIIGEEITVHSTGGAGQWYAVSLDGTTDPTSWPSNVTSCNAVLLSCTGTTTPQLYVVDVSSLGPAATIIEGSVKTLIHASASGPGQNGQDLIQVPGTVPLPFTITGGTNNLNPALVGKPILQSDSVATFPLYDGHTLNIGDPVTVIGFMQLFIENITGGSEDITGRILNVAGCGTNGGTCGAGGGGGSGNSSSISGGGSSAVPVRLISPPAT